MTTPPLAVYDKELARAIGTAYRRRYVTHPDDQPHLAAHSSVMKLMYRRFPTADSYALRAIADNVLAAIEHAHPLWLTGKRPRRNPEASHDASMEMRTLCWKWP